MIQTLALFLFILCNSCTQGKDKSARSTAQDSAQMDSVAYSYQVYKDFSPYFIENGDRIDTTYFQISYPLFEDKTLNDTIRSYILLDGEEKIEEAAETFILGFNEFVEESSTTSVSFAWYKNISSKVWINTPDIMTLSTAVDEYTGGAHGIHYTVLSNFDIATREKIELEDIIHKENVSALTKIAERQFRKNEKLSDTASFSKKYFFENGIFAINYNFGLGENGLIFYYNEYEIKPYVEGPTELEIPYQDILSILNPQGQKYVKSIRQSLN